jgi:hypothetical protein
MNPTGSCSTTTTASPPGFGKYATAKIDRPPHSPEERNLKKNEKFIIIPPQTETESRYLDEYGKTVAVNDVSITNSAPMSIPATSTAESVAAHEIGHNLFLPHSIFPIRERPVGADEKMHDFSDRFCLMGYDDLKPQKFCGKCILRLRGWSSVQLDRDSKKNVKV